MSTPSPRKPRPPSERDATQAQARASSIERYRAGRAAADEAARAALAPLAPGERPLGLIAAILVASALALGNLIAWLAGATIDGKHPGPGVLAFTALTGLLAIGMVLARYWAVLLFQALLTLIILLFSLFLVEATSVGGALLCLAVLVPSGWIFWKLVRVMGRIQVSRQRPRESG